MTSGTRYGLGAAITVALLGGALAVGVAGQDNGKLAPGLKVGGVAVGGMTPEQAATAVAQHNPAPQVTVKAADQSWTVPATTLGWSADVQTPVKAAQQYTAQRTLLERFQGMLGQGKAQDFAVKTSVDPAVARATLEKMTGTLGTQPKNGAVAFDSRAMKYVVTVPETPGRKPDPDAAAQAYAANPAQTTLSVPMTTWQASKGGQKLEDLAALGNKLMRPMTVKLNGTNRVGSLGALQLANFYWVKPEGIVLDDKAIKDAFKGMMTYIDEPARNARYAWKDGKYVKVSEKAGRVTDEAAAIDAFKKAIVDPAAKTVIFPSKAAQPEITLANLPDPAGLQLISRGVSTYYHSSPERRINVANAAQKIDGAMVPAGGVFSFLQNLGGISPDNGFVGGLIISGGRTVDGLGGGVCQVSTTTFRALYSAGLPVVERNQHSYRVGYYEPQVGFEAAVYDPGVDLKFKNDTGGPIMLKTINYPRQSRLVVEVWGTVKPQRSVYVSPATILSRTPHPAPKYVVSPKLRPGQVNQVDWAADGYNLYITRTIKDASGTHQDRTSTSYKPWQAVYEVGPGTRMGG
ncbi:VanW family protein [Deinococcus sp.]|uniref:VanW family protein n=1 Tax=Deinococcus sp. TaxID=47478 RepID=UPI0025B83B36|nr:VanW family protein [Deinococcus sp.]